MPPPQAAQIERLQAEIDRLERRGAKSAGRDQLCPESVGAHRRAGSARGPSPGPFLLSLARPGTLVEWLAEGPGAGADMLAVLTAREAFAADGAMVVVDRRGEFYPPAAVRLGIDPSRLLLVRAGTRADQIWAIDQSLRCSGVAVVLAWPRRLDDRTFRRWQLAAEEGGTLGLLVRPAEARSEPSWAEVRLLVEPETAKAGERRLLPGRPNGCFAQKVSTPFPGLRRLRIHVLRRRGGGEGQQLHVEIDDETYRVSVAAG